jgi:alcohol dehydrogenase class IV
MLPRTKLESPFAMFKQFYSPTRVIHGPGALTSVGAELQKHGKKVLVVTDPGIQKTGLLDPVLENLQSVGFEVQIFSEVESNPTVENVSAGHDARSAFGADVLVAVGGGSPIDTAKAIAVLARNPGKLADYEGFEKLVSTPLPMIAIPTTVGTGSEVTKGAMISDHALHRKLIVVSNHMYPKVAILDPRMVESLPGSICAATGLDALTHAVEAYVCTGQNPFSDAFNLYAIELIGTHLRPAVAGNGNSLHQMQIAACLAGVGFHNAGLGIAHALANTIGGHFSVHHGVTNGILLPHVMRFNLIACPERFARIAETLGERTEKLTAMEAAERAAHGVRSLIADVGMPARLRDLKVTDDLLDQMAREALDQLDRPANPRRNSEANLKSILVEAL